jgi:hypothetical protein
LPDLQAATRKRQPLADSIAGFLKLRRARCVAEWIAVPFGIMAFCGIFFCETDGSVMSLSNVFWSLVDEPQPRSVIKAAVQELHQFYRSVTREARAYPAPSEGPQSN